MTDRIVMIIALGLVLPLDALLLAYGVACEGGKIFGNEIHLLAGWLLIFALASWGFQSGAGYLAKIRKSHSDLNEKLRRRLLDPEFAARMLAAERSK